MKAVTFTKISSVYAGSWRDWFYGIIIVQSSRVDIA